MALTTKSSIRELFSISIKASRFLTLVQLFALGILLFGNDVSRADTLIDEDFEGLFPPAGWVGVHNSGIGNFSYTAVTGHNGNGGSSGFAGHIGDNTSNFPVPGNIDVRAGGPAGWMQLPVIIDSNFDWTLMADIKIGHEGPFDDATIVFGDINPGLGSAKDYYGLIINEEDISNDVFYHENNIRITQPNPLVVDYASGISDDTWYKMTMSWVAVNETLAVNVSTVSGVSKGSFSVVLDGSNNASNPNPSLTSFPDGIQIGLGTINDRANYDNVLLVGTAVVPEPSTIILAVFATVGFISFGWNRNQMPT